MTRNDQKSRKQVNLAVWPFSSNFGPFPEKAYQIHKGAKYNARLNLQVPFLSNQYFMESIRGFCFVAHMDVSVPTHDWVVVVNRHRTQSCCGPRRDRRPTVSTASCRNLPKNERRTHKTSGSLNYPWIGGEGITHNEYRFMYFANFEAFPL